MDRSAEDPHDRIGEYNLVLQAPESGGASCPLPHPFHKYQTEGLGVVSLLERLLE